MRFDLTDLRLFMAVVDAGSITHGAAEVGLSLAAASERLREMETTGKVQLLSRGRRGVAPTEAGEMLAHHARTILQQMAHMRGEIGHYAKGVRASVRIFANTAAVSEFLPGRLAPWMAAHPQVDITLKERESADIARSVRAGFAEIGVLSDAVEPEGLFLRPFATDRLVVVMPKGQPLAGNRQVRFSELLDQMFIGLFDGALQAHLEAHAHRLGSKLKVRVRLRSFDAVCRMAGAGAGIGIVPEAAARRCKRSTQIAIVRLQEPWATRQLSICVTDLNALPPPARSIFDFLSQPTSLACNPSIAEEVVG